MPSTIFNINNTTTTTRRGISQPASRQLLTLGTLVQSQFSSCEFCGGQSDTGMMLSPSTSDFPCQCYSPMIQAYSFIWHRDCISSAIDSVIVKRLQKYQQLWKILLVCLMLRTKKNRWYVFTYYFM